MFFNNLSYSLFVLFIHFFKRMPTIYTGICKFVQKIYICIWSAVEHAILHALVCAALEWFPFGAKGNGRTSFANGLVSKIVRDILTIHGYQYIAWNECIWCWAWDTNCFIHEQRIEQTTEEVKRNTERRIYQISYIQCNIAIEVQSQKDSTVELPSLMHTCMSVSNSVTIQRWEIVLVV